MPSTSPPDNAASARFASAYRPGVFEFRYQRPTPVEPAEPRPFMPGVTHEMLVGVVGTVTEKWEKPAGWLLTGFAAVVALLVSNYDKAVGVIGTGAAHSVVLLFFLAAVAHAVQQFFSTLVQAGAAGGKLGRELDLKKLNAAELRQLMDGLVAAYPWPMKAFLRGKYDQMLEHGLAPFSKSMARMAATVVWSAVAQMLFGLIAIGVVTWAVLRTTWLPPVPNADAAGTAAPVRPGAPAAGPLAPK